MSSHLFAFSFSNMGSVQWFWLLGGLLFLVLCWMIYRQQRQSWQLKKELKEIEAQSGSNIEYEFILKAMKLASWHLDPVQRTITFDNDYRDSLGSYTPEGDTNIDDWAEHLVYQDRRRVRYALDDLCEGRSDVFHQQYQVVSAQLGNTYWEESYATVGERDEDGQPSRIVGASMRIDERKAMENDLILARNKAEESDRLKTAFLANIGHEIRTPLNAIIGFADLLPVVQSEEDRQQLVSEIQSNNHKLLGIINGLVSMSEIEAGARSLAISAVDVNELLMLMASNYQTATDVEVSYELPEKQMLIHSDREILTEVLNHLMDNAVKFTTKGSITIGYTVETDQLCLWVKDTGKGISIKDQARIFDRFVKLDEYVPGAGLGLSVVQSHVSHLGGTVGVESKIGEGSTFWVRLPIN
jgi:signal transduction histidine kinase